jgi:hypothetical protein
MGRYSHPYPSAAGTLRKSPPISREAGFSLAEVLLAATLGTLLLLATMHSTGVFVESVTMLESGGVDELDRALERIAQDVRYAWWVDVPSAGVLRIADPAGQITRYERDGSELKVTTHTGAIGVLAKGLSALVFDAETISRYREGTPQLESAPIASAGGVADQTGRIGENGMFVSYFRIDSDAGEGSVSGVNEQVISATPETLRLRVGYGDLPIVGAPMGRFEVQIRLSAGHGDATDRMGSSALGSKTFVNASLPSVMVKPALLNWVGPQSNQVYLTNVAGNKSFKIQDDNILYYLSVGYGIGNKRTETPVYEDLFELPLTDTVLDVSMAGVTLEPGVSYKLSLFARDYEALLVLGGTSVLPSTAVVHKGSVSETQTNSDLAIPFVLRGTRTITSTTESVVVSSVTATATRSDDGSKHSTTAPVFSQTLVADPWLGVVPGELGAAP